jgi:hypothetical protein
MGDSPGKVLEPYSGGEYIESRTGRRISRLSSSVIFLICPSLTAMTVRHLGRDRFLPNSFQFTIHLSPYRWKPYIYIATMKIS